MKIVFDQGTPAPLRKSLTLHDVSTLYELGGYTPVFLSDICEIEHLKISQSGDTTRIINEQDTLNNKTADLKSFFKPFQKDISNFCFDREEANAR